MSDDEKGVYISISTHLKGEFYDLFLKEVEKQATAWIQSEEGKTYIQAQVRETIHRNIDMRFSFCFDKNPNFTKFRDIIVNRLLKELVETVGGEFDPNAPVKDT